MGHHGNEAEHLGGTGLTDVPREHSEAPAEGYEDTIEVPREHSEAPAEGSDVDDDV